MMDTIRKKSYNPLLFYVGCFVAVLAMFWVFYLMAYGFTSSDIPSHTAFIVGLKEEGFSKMSLPHILAYPMYHVFLYVLNPLLGGFERASIIVLTASNAATILLVRNLLNVVVEEKKPIVRYLIDIVSVSSVFIMGICGFLTQGHFYSMQGGPNVWHNPTFIFVRPLGILTLIFFNKVWLALQSQKKCTKELVLFSVFLALSCLAKPSFAFVFLPAAGLFVGIHLLKTKMKGFLNIGVPLLLAVLPSVAILLVQFFYVKNAIIGIVSFKVAFGTYNNLSVWQSILATLSLFIIIVYVFATTGYKHVKNEPIYALSLIMAIVGWLQFFFLQQGNGIASGDYFWGYGLAIYCVTMLSMAMLMKHQDKKWIRYIGYGIYGAQFFYGIVYFVKIALCGSIYYI